MHANSNAEIEAYRTVHSAADAQSARAATGWLSGLIVLPAFGFAGVDSRSSMNAFSIAWGAILPLRWYMAVLLGQAARVAAGGSAVPVRGANGTGRALPRARALSPALAGQHGRDRRGWSPAPPPPRRAVSRGLYRPNGGVCSGSRSFVILVMAAADLRRVLRTLSAPDNCARFDAVVATT